MASGDYEWIEDAMSDEDERYGAWLEAYDMIDEDEKIGIRFEGLASAIMRLNDEGP